MARNLGVANTSAELITFLDSDDEAEASWLTTIVRPFESSEVGIVCAGFKKIGSGAGETTNSVHLPHDGGPLYGNQVVAFIAGAFALRRELFVGAGGYRDQAARQQQELGQRVTMLALNNGYKVVSIAEPLIRWHQHDGPRISTDPQAYYDGTLATIANEGKAIRKVSRREYARLRRSAATGAMRLGLPREARGHLLHAIRSDKTDWRAYVRLGEAWFATLFRRSRDPR